LVLLKGLARCRLTAFIFVCLAGQARPAAK
jgi:hypothetical protein